jgi:hypothetical protein
MCNANTYWQYHTDDITITVDNDPNTEESCRDNVCGGLISFADRWTGGRFEWARMLNSESGHRPSLDTAKEAK